MVTEPELSAYEQLTAKQKAFVDALCLEPNMSGRKAAIEAGYNKAGAAVEAHNCLRNAKVRKALGERLQDTAPTTEEIAARWDRVSRATLDDFYSIRKVASPTKIEQPLEEAIAATEESIRYQYELMTRSWPLLGTSADDQAKELEQHEQWVKQRRVEILNYQLQLEKDTSAFRIIDGPPETKKVLELDLMKAKRRGVLDLAKSIKPSQHGFAIELRDPDAALDKLARIAGAYKQDNEQLRPIAAINAKVEIINSGPPLASSEKEVQM
ncbi:terminase small subunit [Hymenobacter sp.]|jgi:hypothetical protein|uniref:terminase small subunit n=1 Tax=Hymenobacter sp. TaxID=1898978 RepID=UPI002EDA87C7